MQTSNIHRNLYKTQKNEIQISFESFQRYLHNGSVKNVRIWLISFLELK
jgi:hypothetical protein